LIDLIEERATNGFFLRNSCRRKNKVLEEEKGITISSNIDNTGSLEAEAAEILLGSLGMSVSCSL